MVDAKDFADNMTNGFGGNMPYGELPAMKSIEKVSFSMNVNDYLNIDAAGHFSDSEKAELFHDSIKGMLSIAKLAVSTDRDAVDVLNKFDISVKDNVVHVDVELSKADFEKLQKQRSGMAMLR